MSFQSIYISTPGALHTITDPTTVYILSSINPLANEIIIRDATGFPAGQRFVVSTAQGLRFSPSLSTQTLSSFTATTPYSFITVAPHTPTEYMLLEAPGFPTRSSRLDLAPNYLYLSTLSTLTTTATKQATLGTLVLNGTLQATPATLQISTLQATRISTNTIYTRLAQTNNTATSNLQTNTITYSANPSFITALSTQTLSTAISASFTKDFLLTSNLNIGPNSNIQVAGTSHFGSTLVTSNIIQTGPTHGFGSTVYAPSTNIIGTISSLATYGIAGAHTTSNYQAISYISSTAYVAGRTVAQSLQLGPSVNPSYQLYVDGKHRITGNYTTQALSTNQISTLSASASSIRYRNATGTNVSLNATGDFIFINGNQIIPERSIGRDMYSLLGSNWVSTPNFITSNIIVNSSVRINYTPSSYQYSLELQGSAFFSTNLVMDNLAVYGGTNPNAFQNPAFNTIYSSTNGLLLNNRFFIDTSKNFVGINTTNPQYFLDISATLYHANPTAFNTATTWVALSDETAKENICKSRMTEYVEAFENLKLKEFTYEPTFAAIHRLPTNPQLGFLAQDVELYFPNAVLEKPFYNYPDFHFLTTDQIIKAHQAITRMMLSTVSGHSTIIGNQWVYISTANAFQDSYNSNYGPF